ncbi:ABC transporter ATP-binding protein [Paenibacillus macerans]|uniref:ABC transporter family protein n=1 Tax=Paenibacillus macerans TaxID=44252 RepID=A0A090YQJ4_PAEMA|nr:ABC transporter ATP-binding protein [Paenibacillus macerans]KFM94400.1 ABC transporter family protein [Paenibacillus macerans]MBS5909553.1 ABC transporter ATP-binding protein [Paenibacillus macerans]MCY7557219.1 ABC transporter ATP-binding protein [Paenibacillus macerans]MDU5947143.1 ABC transporter ATP-binding protein [Paenibacillus macerans]MEC0141363.1 ABC transporter ATP-binding protein [Paenibacillus macerans]
MLQPASSPKISCKNLNKIYRSKRSETYALKDINMDIEDNEFICVVGPSGCGKSTLLRIFAGLDEATSGDVMLGDRVMTGPGADRGMVFQAYTLFPWLSVEQNIRFGLKLKKMPKDEADRITEKYLSLVGLTDFRGRLPKELSGGMKQRVAIARALANSPEVLLMDEPFGALDPDTKGNMQLQLRELWEQEKHTVIFITHDIEEAVFLSQRVYVMSARPGRIIADIPIDLPARRDLELKDTLEFIQIRKRIHGLLHSGDFRNDLYAAT